jgi:hypothetical protein
MKKKFLKNSGKEPDKSKVSLSFWKLPLAVMIITNLTGCKSRNNNRNAGYDLYRTQILDTCNIFGSDSINTEIYFSLIKQFETHS